MEILKQNNSIEKQESGMIQALENIGIDDSLLAMSLGNILQNATRMNNNGDIHEDYETKLKAIQTIIKIKNPKFGQNNINIAMFTPPPANQPLKY